MSWPKDKTVAAAFRGTVSEIITTPLGKGKGVRSADRWVYLIVGPKPFIFCERCGTSEKPPDPPGSGAPGEARNPLIAPGTKTHALFILTRLHRFTDVHTNCKVSEDPS